MNEKEIMLGIMVLKPSGFTVGLRGALTLGVIVSGTSNWSLNRPPVDHDRVPLWHHRRRPEALLVEINRLIRLKDVRS